MRAQSWLHAWILSRIAAPLVDLDVSGSMLFLSGRPLPQFVTVRLPQGVRQVLIEEPGEHRLPSTWSVDLSLLKAFALNHLSFELRADLRNLFNASAAEELFTGDIASRNLGRPSRWQVPRRLFVGVGFALD